jgi:hypothetical protein
MCARAAFASRIGHLLKSRARERLVFHRRLTNPTGARASSSSSRTAGSPSSSATLSSKMPERTTRRSSRSARKAIAGAETSSIFPATRSSTTARVAGLSCMPGRGNAILHAVNNVLGRTGGMECEDRGEDERQRCSLMVRLCTADALQLPPEGRLAGRASGQRPGRRSRRLAPAERRVHTPGEYSIWRGA